jgi:acyl-[acyl-carrier-protein] desaturase
LQIIDALFKEDPNGACLAYYDMMKKQILMPAHMMDDGEHQQKTGRNLFAVSVASIRSTPCFAVLAVCSSLECCTCRFRRSR